MRSPRCAGARGGTTVVVLAVFVVGMVLMLGAARVGAALVTRARAQTAADAAALAAADALALGGPMAARADAADTASDNGARLVSCDCDGPRVTVTVEVHTPVLDRVARVRASAELDGPVIPAP